MRSSLLGFWLTSLVLVGLVHCGGKSQVAATGGAPNAAAGRTDEDLPADGGGGAGDASADGCAPIGSAAQSDTGFDACDDGTIRRRTAIPCPDANRGCRTDADCGTGLLCECSAAITPALAGRDFGGCRPATCRTNAECGPGSSCVGSADGAQHLYPIGFNDAAGATGDADRGDCIHDPETIYTCQTSADQCRSDRDCNGGTCVVLDAHRVCLPSCTD